MPRNDGAQRRARPRGRAGRWIAALTVAVLALPVAGCGSDDGGGSSTGSAAGTAAAAAAKATCGLANGRRATGTPIKVGAVVGATGPADFSSAAKSAKAYFDCVNANGGIDGRPVRYLVEDDGWNPEKAGQVARKLVEDEKVVAMIGSTSFVECGVNAKYYEQRDVLVVAGVGVPRECFHSRNIAPTNQGPRLSGIGAAQYAKQNGAKSIACVANSIPNFGGWVCEGVEAWGRQAGVEVKSFNGKPDASDAESITLKALGAKTDAVVLVDAAPAMAAYLKVAQQQGSGGEDRPWYLPTSAYDLSFPKTVGAYWNDKLTAAIELAPLDGTGRDNATWSAIMDEYGGDAPRDSFSQAGYLAAKIFVDTALKLEGQVDRASVGAALRDVRDFKTDLLCAPWYFGDGDRHNPNHAGRVVRQTGEGETGFSTIEQCREIEDPELRDVRDAERGA
ncbi:ABC transporter substrate-binding protein [Patulibacter medicamentivorans]|nr:ABC transporter substrate-binding protein [Patulibacter medicamentivorans]